MFENTKSLIDTIRRTSCISDFLSTSALFYPNTPKQFDIDEVQKMKLNFSRHSKRTMYYAVNFLEKYTEAVRGLIPEVSIGRRMVPISDDVFFDFDAFVFSAKSIVEGNILRGAKRLHPDVRTPFMTFSKEKFKDFIQTRLRPIRDEVVHLNNFGTAIGSFVHINEDHKFFFHTEYSPDVDLIGLFADILANMSDIIVTISRYIILHECYLWGFPRDGETFKYGDHCIKISDLIWAESF